MALIACPDCGNRVSDLAAACPKCGRPTTPGASTPPRSDPGPAAPSPDRSKVIARGVFLLIAIVLIVLVSIISSEKRLVGTGTQASPRVAVPPPPHQVTDIHGAGTKSIWYFIVVGKATSTTDLEKIAAYYAAQHRNASVLNVDIFCDTKYASYATGIESAIPDREYYSHVVYDYMTGKFAQAHGPIDHPGLGSACGK